MAAHGIKGFLQKDSVGDAGNFHRILKGQENTITCAFLWRQVQEVLSFIEDLPLCNLIAVPAGQYVGQGTLSGAVGPHDRMGFTGIDLQAQPFEDFGSVNRSMKIFDFQHVSDDLFFIRVA